MHLKYLFLSNLNIDQIAQIDLSNIDKLFLTVKLRTFEHVRYIHIDKLYYDLLNQFDANKVILFLTNEFIYFSDMNLIEIKEITKFQIIEPYGSYVYSNYNFIHTIDHDQIISQLLIDKTNISLDYHEYESLPINDELRLLNSEIFIKMIIQPSWTLYLLSIRMSNDLTYVCISDIRQPPNVMQYIKLIEDKVYLKTINQTAACL